MADLAEIKAKYPQYSDMSDSDFADKFYQKFYSDMPRDQFDQKLGVKSTDSVLAGLAQSALNASSVVAGGLGGGLGYLGTLAATGGDQDAAKAVQEGIQDKIKYNPTNSVAKKIGDFTNESFGKLTDQLAETQGKTLESLGFGKPDADLMHAVSEGYLNVAPVGALAKIRGGSIIDRFNKKVETPEIKPPTEAPVEPVDPNLELYKQRAEQAQAEAQAQAQKPLYADQQGNVSPELSPQDMPYLPPLPEDAPRLPEPAGEASTPLPELFDPVKAGDEVHPPIMGENPDLKLADPNDPLPRPQGDQPFPELPKPDNPLLDLQDRPAINARPPDTPYPSIDFPDRTTTFDNDPWLRQAGDRVQELQGKTTPEAKAEIQALTEHAVDLAKNSYGIDANTARQALYEHGDGVKTQGEIKKTFSQRGLGGKQQSGSFDMSAFVPQSLIDRFKKKADAPEGTVPVAKTQMDALPKSLREHFMPIDNPQKVLDNVLNKHERDIPGNAKEGINDFKRSFGSGIRLHAERTGNSVLMFTNTMLDRGQSAAKASINKFLNGKDGVASLLRKVPEAERVKAFQALKMEDKYNTRYKPAELESMGLSPKTAALFDAIHAMHDDIFGQSGRGDYRAGYFPHSWRGDYTAVVRDAEGNTKRVIGAKNMAEMKTAIEKTKAEFPDHSISDISRKPIRSERSWNRGVLTIQDMMGILKDKGELSNEAISNIINDRDIKSTRNLFGGNVHELNRSQYEVDGWDGNKSWLTDAQNAADGWKSLIATAEQQYFHHALQEPTNAIKGLLANEDLKTAQPFATKAAESYMHDMTGAGDPWATARGINTVVDATAEVFGKGGNSPVAIKDGIRKFTHLWQLGVNIKNFAVQLTQPVVSGLPYLKLLTKAEGLGTVEATRGATLGIARYIRSLTEDKLSKTDQFTKDLTQYATENGMRSFAETENAMDAANSKFVRVLDKVGNALPGTAEKITRAPTFSVIASMLKESWDKDPTKFTSQQELFDTAKNYTQTIMVDYGQNPTGYRKLFGVGGSLIGQFKTYGFATTGALRVLWAHDKVAFATAVGMLTYVTGIKGLPLYQDLDNLVKDAAGIFGDKLVDIEDLLKKNWGAMTKVTGLADNTLYKNNAPSADSMMHGGLSQQLGYDVQPQFGFSNTIPQVDFQSQSSPGAQIAANITPSMQGIGQPLMKTGKALLSGNRMDELAAVKSILPGQLRGIMENQVLTTKQGNVVNPDNGMYQAHTRTPDEQMARNFNLTSNQEVRDKEAKFKGDQQRYFLAQKEKDIVTDVMKKSMTGTINDGDLNKAVTDYVKAGGDPKTFMSSLINELQKAHTEGLARGAGIPTNSVQSINRYYLYHPELTQQQR